MLKCVKPALLASLVAAALLLKGQLGWTAICSVPTPISKSSFEEKLASSEKLYSFKAMVPRFQNPSNLKRVPIQNNVILKNCSGYPGGESALARDFENAVDRGFRCLGGLKKKYGGVNSDALASDARYIMGYFDGNYEKRLTIICQSPDNLLFTSNHSEQLSSTEEDFTIARALTCSDLDDNSDDTDYPGIKINLESKTWENEIAAQSTLFHELLHHAGYNHHLKRSKKGIMVTDKRFFDVVNTAENCCFADRSIPAFVTSDQRANESFKALVLTPIQVTEKISCQMLSTYKHGTVFLKEK